MVVTHTNSRVCHRQQHRTKGKKIGPIISATISPIRVQYSRRFILGISYCDVSLFDLTCAGIIRPDEHHLTRHKSGLNFREQFVGNFSFIKNLLFMLSFNATCLWPRKISCRYCIRRLLLVPHFSSRFHPICSLCPTSPAPSLSYLSLTIGSHIYIAGALPLSPLRTVRAYIYILRVESTSSSLVDSRRIMHRHAAIGAFCRQFVDKKKNLLEWIHSLDTDLTEYLRGLTSRLPGEPAVSGKARTAWMLLRTSRGGRSARTGELAQKVPA